MNGSTIHRKAQQSSTSDPLGDFLSERAPPSNGRTLSTRRQPQQNVTINPTFQKVLLLLILVVLFDVHYVYQFFSSSTDSEHAAAEVGVVNMKSARMDGLADHVISKLKSERSLQSDGAINSSAKLRKKPKVEPSWKMDKRMNPDLISAKEIEDRYDNAVAKQHPHQKKPKIEPSWKTDKRMNPAYNSEQDNNGYEDKSMERTDETAIEHLGISSGRFNSLNPDEQIEELQLEVQLWKGRYDMTFKKLQRLEGEFAKLGANLSSVSHLPDHEVNALLYEGLDVEAVNQDVNKLTQQDDANELYDPYKTDVFDKSEETYGVDAHILKILQAAGVEIDEELANILPTWEDVVSMYGSKPIISGLETCPEYRAQVKPEDRMTGPAGMFNTGTNLLYELLKANCVIEEARLKPRREPKHNGMRWQAPWGKHNPPSTHRGKNVAKAWGKGIKQDDFMPVVLIKDPYTWMGSQCRHKYSSFWGHDENHCPNLIRWKVTNRPEPSEVIVKFALGMKKYESLLDMWNSWYTEWEQMSFPHLMTRFEDLLFHGEEVVRSACECVGGVFTDEFQYVEDSAKPSTLKVHAGSNGLVAAMVQYGDPAKRLTGFTERDMIYADQAMNKALMNKYGYIPPPPLIEQEQ